MTAIVIERQSVFDLAVQYLGGADGCFTVAQRLGVEITDTIKAGMVFEYSIADIVNKNSVKYYNQNGIVPTSEVAENEIPCVGIDYWHIGIDFEITF